MESGLVKVEDIISILMKNLEGKKDALTRYREVQNLQLTQIQAEILDAIDEDKLEEATLRDLVGAFNILKQRELVDVGKPTDIHGLVGYLTFLDRKASGISQEEINAEFTVIEDNLINSEEGEEYVPNL